MVGDSRGWGLRPSPLVFIMTDWSYVGSRKDITGERFGKLTVVREAGRKQVGKNRCKSILWLCRCDCGNETTATTSNLRTGNIRSCGCLRLETLVGRRKFEGSTTSERGKARALGTLYNLSLTEYKKILKFQKGICPITGYASKRFVVDHDHRTGLVRGLIDWKINRALEAFHDDPAMLRRAADYLDNPTATAALGEEVYGVIGCIDRKASNRRYGPYGTTSPIARTLNTQQQRAAA